MAESYNLTNYLLQAAHAEEAQVRLRAEAIAGAEAAGYRLVSELDDELVFELVPGPPSDTIPTNSVG